MAKCDYVITVQCRGGGKKPSTSLPYRGPRTAVGQGYRTKRVAQARLKQINADLKRKGSPVLLVVAKRCPGSSAKQRVMATCRR